MSKWICPIHDQEEWYCIKDGEETYHNKRSKEVEEIFKCDKPLEEAFGQFGYFVPKGVTTNKTPPKKKRK